jgi:DNA (cytosine-5)-methyltransferase 1
VENDDAARATATAFGLVHTHDDVTTYRIDRQFQGLKASPPCQTFSAAGNGAGRKQLDVVVEQLHRVAEGHPLDYAHYDDARTGLVLEPLRIILEAFHLGWPFRWIVMEQVPAVLPVWEEYAKVLAPLGYSVATGNLQAEQYGVPQTRKRAVLIASRDREAKLPTPTHSKYHTRTPNRLDPGVLPWISMAQALGYDDFVQEQQQGSGMLARQGRVTRPIREDAQPSFTITGADGGGSARLRMISNYGSGGDPKNRGERTTDEPAPTITSKINRNKWKWLRSNHGYREHPRDAETQRLVVRDGDVDWYYRTPINAPSPTISTNIRASHWDNAEPLGSKSYKFSSESRRVSVQEAAILQTFPTDYPWRGGKTKQYQQVGNAIPPLLARAILQQVI